ncbi:MAG: DUF1294 domain-containing protein [Ruminococcus sp.]|nr:DUF1294 domain-containing protein [Ruminococcus sp.]
MNAFISYFLLYLLAVNFFAFCMTVFDKRRAIRGGRRVRESTLLTVAAIGGSVGMFLTMRAIRHKTRKKKFMLGIPAIFLLQVAAAFGIWRLLHG